MRRSAVRSRSAPPPFLRPQRNIMISLIPATGAIRRIDRVHQQHSFSPEKLAAYRVSGCGIGAQPGRFAMASATPSVLDRAAAFCSRFGLRVPVLLAPMAGACPPSLSIAVANAGGLGACGALLMQPAAILQWAADVRAASNGPFQLNLWIPDPPPRRDAAHEAAVRDFLTQWGPRGAAERRRCSAARFRRAMRGPAGSRHRRSSPRSWASIRPRSSQRLKAARHRLVRECLHRGRGACRRGCRRRCRRGAGHGGGRPSRLLRRGARRRQAWSACSPCCRRSSTRCACR